MIRTSTMLLAAMVLCVSAAAQSNPDSGPVFAKTPTNIPFRLPLSSGTVDENTYKNDSLGLQITPPRGLKFGAPELKGKPGTVPLLVTVAAWGTAFGETVFYADDLGYYPEDRRSTKAYVERVFANRKRGCAIVICQGMRRDSTTFTPKVCSSWCFPAS